MKFYRTSLKKITIINLFNNKKVLHPKTEHSHSHGLELENETDHKDYVIHGHSYEGGPVPPQSHSYETIEHQGDFEGSSFSGSSEPKDFGHHNQFQDITVHHGHGQ